MLPKNADIVIIGGGIIGCAIAFNLAKLGAKNVVLLEKESMLGTGSTAKCSGGIRQQFVSPTNVRLSIESVRIFKKWQEEFPFEVEFKPDFRQTGYLFLLHSPEQIEESRARIAMYHELGIRDVGLMNLDQVAVALPYLNMNDVSGAVFCASDGVADPASVLAEYERQARMLGVRILTGVAVTDIGTNHRGTDTRHVEIVFTDKGPILTPCVINAAGPFANRVGRMLGLEIPVVPYRHQTIVTPPIKWVSRNDPLVVDCLAGGDLYFRPEAGSEETGYQLLFGGHENDKVTAADPDSYKTKPDEEFLLYLIDRIMERFKSVEEIRFLPKSGLAGLYESTSDVLPILGKTSEVEGLILANGFSGHGFMHSPAIGKIIAEIALIGRSSFDVAGLGLDDFKNNTRAPAEKAVV